MSYLTRHFRSRLPCSINPATLALLTPRTALRNQSSQVSNPQSSNPESQAINVARGKEARHDDTPDTKSVQSPISSQFGPTSEKHEGEEPSTTTEQVYNDPKAPAEKKRRNVEQAGRRPMGPEDEN